MEEEKPSESTTKGITITTAEQFTEQTSISTTDGSNANPMSANLTKKATQFLLTLVTSTPATTMEVGPPDWVRSVEESFRQKFLDHLVTQLPYCFILGTIYRKKVKHNLQIMYLS